jgi:hypothetical protein
MKKIIKNFRFIFRVPQGLQNEVLAYCLYVVFEIAEMFGNLNFNINYSIFSAYDFIIVYV